jgi:iron complex outermembrane receptor protein
MGGVINIITKNNKSKGMGVSFNNNYGSFNTLINELGLNYADSKTSFFSSYNHSETEGHRDYTSFNMNGGYVKGSYVFNEYYNIVADFNSSKFRTFDPGTVYDPQINNWVEISRKSLGFAFNNTYEYFDGGIKYYYNWGENKIYDGWHSTDYNTNLLLYQNVRVIKNNVSTFGVDYKHYGGEGENKLSPTFSSNFIEGKNYIDDIGFYIMSQHYFSNSLTASAGVRYENNSTYGNHIIPQVGVAYHLNERNTIKGTISKGFRSPIIRELFLFPVRNADLKPVELWNYEISFLNFLAENISLETALFISNGNNMIIQEGAQLKNSGSFKNKGIEFSGRYFINDQLSLNLNYTYLDSDKQTENNPRHNFYVETVYNINKFNINLNLKQISKLYGEDNSRLVLPDYTLLNCNISYSFTNFISVYLTGNNLLNQEYQTMNGYVMPKSTYMVGLNINY